MTTIFERIITGELSASFVHQDARCVAFMDINPVTRGHVLVVPRRAVATLDQLDALTRAHLWETANRIGRAQRQGLGSRAQHLLVNDGKAASQTVPHVHIHVIPRYGSDTLHTLARLAWHITTIAIPRRETPELRGKLEAAAAQIRSAL